MRIVFLPSPAAKEAIRVVACARIASFPAGDGTSRKGGVCFVTSEERSNPARSYNGVLRRSSLQ
ncbi:MAG: hypothetical protein LBJ47_05735 [Tannerella sp.]|nr:hypothetical protein [Tannerella sp.]